MNSPLLEKSMDFATQIVLFYEEFSKSKKDTTIAKQQTPDGCLLLFALGSALTDRKKPRSAFAERGSCLWL